MTEAGMTGQNSGMVVNAALTTGKLVYQAQRVKKNKPGEAIAGLR
ncbi:hypothetical protein [uncultured Agrobacterium sp.]|nr:hypothetical protein [uncultured Agrobacterium sp.]